MAKKRKQKRWMVEVKKGEEKVANVLVLAYNCIKAERLAIVLMSDRLSCGTSELVAVGNRHPDPSDLKEEEFEIVGYIAVKKDA